MSKCPVTETVSPATMRYWMEKAIEEPLHLSPPQAEEGRASLEQCLQQAEAGQAFLAACEGPGEDVTPLEWLHALLTEIRESNWADGREDVSACWEAVVQAETLLENLAKATRKAKGEPKSDEDEAALVRENMRLNQEAVGETSARRLDQAARREQR